MHSISQVCLQGHLVNAIKAWRVVLVQQGHCAATAEAGRVGPNAQYDA